MNFNQALTILKKDEEEERNWRSARAKLAEVVEAAIAADVALESAKMQKTALESDVAVLRTAYGKLDADYTALQQSYGQLEAAHRTKKQTLDDSLATTRGEVAAAQQLKHDTEAQLAKITADWHLKTGQAASH